MPGSAALIADYAARSARARADLACRPDVPYGTGERQRLDIFPAGPDAPVHVFLHGGAWRNLDRRMAATQAAEFVAAGIAYVAAGFDLATEVSLTEMVAQARAAVAWVGAHARDFGADAARLTIAGHSSGAHMAAMVALTDWGPHGLPPDLVKGVALVSGLYDLEPVRLSYRNALLKLDTAAARALSPVHGRPRPGLRLVVGRAEHETGEFRRQTADLAAAWGAGPPIVASGRNHYDVAFDFGDADTALGRAILAMAG